MTIDKKRINNLIKWADEALREQNANEEAGVSKILNGNDIVDSYNGSVAALGVSVAMGGLRPAMAIYYQDKTERKQKQKGSDKGDTPKANRRSVLDVVARIITKDTDNTQWNFAKDKLYAKNLFRYVIEQDDANLKQEVIDCSIALKQVVRTYNLVKTEKQ